MRRGILAAAFALAAVPFSGFVATGVRYALRSHRSGAVPRGLGRYRIGFRSAVHELPDVLGGCRGTAGQNGAHPSSVHVAGPAGDASWGFVLRSGVRPVSRPVRPAARPVVPASSASRSG